jgi:hypothetical protein
VKTILLLVIIAIGVGVSVRAKHERTASEAALRDVSAEHAALRHNVTRERQRLQLARDARSSPRVGSRSEAAGTITAPSRPLSPEAALANNPALLAEHLRNLHDVPDWGFAQMFHAVGFSPEQIAQWKQMIVQGSQRRLDLIAAVEAQGLGRNSETFKMLNAENEKLRRQREAEILGDLEPKYREYQRLEGTRGLVEWLTRTGVYLEEPITGQQIERATQILAANTREVLRSSNGQEAPVIDWATTAAQLKDILSPSQIATLQKLGEQFEKVGLASQRVDERTKLLTAQFKRQRGR